MINEEGLYKKILLSSFVFISIFCTGVRSPDWVNKPYEKFSPQKYIVGVGGGYSKDDSDKSARAEILKQIKVSISEKMEVGTQAQISESTKGKKFEISEDVSRKIREEIEGTLEGVIIAERFLDKAKGIWYSLAVFDKSEFVKKLLREVSEMDSDILAEVKRLSEEIFDWGKVGLGVRKFVEVERKLKDLKSKEIFLGALGADYKSLSWELFGKMKAKLSDLNVSLETQEQVPEPITYIEIKISSDVGGIPARGVPIKIKLKNGFSEKIYNVITDEKGKAKVADVVFFDYGQNRVELYVDLPYIQSLGVVSVNSEKKIVLEVDSPYAFLKNAISRCVAQKKLEVSESGGDYKLFGDLSYGLIYSGKNYKGEPLHISQALVILKLIDSRAKTVIFEHSFLSKGVGETEKGAILRSISSAISNLCDFAISESDLAGLFKEEKQRKETKDKGMISEADMKPFDLVFKPLTSEGEAEIEIVLRSHADGYFTVNGIFLARVEGGKVSVQGMRMLTARLLSQLPLTAREVKDSGIKFRFPLQPGENNVKVEFVSDSGGRYAEIAKITRKAPDMEVKVRTYVVAVGVSKYKNPKFNLKYARTDAERFIQMFQGPNSEVFKILDEESTRENIIGKLFELAQRVREGDRVFIFLAGHGVRHKATGSYYFITYDAGVDNFAERALKWSDVIEIISLLSEKISSSVILFLDTCHSGADGDLVGVGLGGIFPNIRNVFVLSSSSQDEVSYESDDLKQGLFTFSVLEGIREWRADLDGDGVIMLSEVFYYTSKRVRELSKGRQNPFFRIVGSDMAIASR